MAEEYADPASWQDDSTVFRAVKKLERAGIRRADQIVVLTRRMRDWLVEKKLASAEKIEVIPCCVDFTRYEDQQHDAAEVGAAERFEVVYAGSVTGLYLLEEMGRFFLELRMLRPNSFLRVLTMSPPEEARPFSRRAGPRADDFGRRRPPRGGAHVSSAGASSNSLFVSDVFADRRFADENTRYTRGRIAGGEQTAESATWNTYWSWKRWRRRRRRVQTREEAERPRSAR